MDWQKHYDRGMTLDEFLEAADEKDRNALLEVYYKATLGDKTVKRIKDIRRPIKILAFAEIWCPDCIVNLPALELMKAQNRLIDYRILPRQGNEELLKDYKVDGKAKIPTFLLFDEAFNLLGVFIEQPKIVKEVVESGNQPQIIVTKRAYRKGDYLEHTLQEILGLL